MPKYFHFYNEENRNPEHNTIFNGKLTSMRCQSILANGNQCKRNCVIGLPYCSSHLPKEMKVQIKKSLIPNSGKGVFALDKTKGQRDIVFKENNTIGPYFGETIDRNTLERRYGNKTAPYGIAKNRDLFEDGALQRGVLTLINHKRSRQDNVRFSIGRNNTVVVKAKKNIKNGQELYVNYGNRYKFNENVHTRTNNSMYF
jgi:hypothetical protein